MNTWIVFFVLGCFSALGWTALPSAAVVVVLLLLTLICGYFRQLGLSGLVMGLVWMSLVAHWHLSWQLPEQQIKQPVWVEGQVTSIIVHQQQKVRFNLDVQQFDSRPVNGKPPTFRLSWNEPTFSLQQGQVVKLLVNLKPAHGLANNVPFHYQQWLFANGIRATGYVLKNDKNRAVSETASLRQQWINQFITLPLQNSRWLAAISLGYRGLLEPADWQLAQRTGISHLIAISGLHLGIVTALCYALFSYAAVRLCRQERNIHIIGITAAMLAALCYSAVAGFSLPTIRAWLMVLVISILLMQSWHWRPRQILLCCLMIFMLFMPLSVLSVSFWLSFSAVLIIGFIYWRWPVAGQGFSIRQSATIMIRLQLSLSLLMLPLVGLQFGLVSLVAPLVNLIAVPLVTLILVPLCLIGLLVLVFSETVAMWLFTLADHLLTYCLSGLNWLNPHSFAAVNVAQIPSAAWWSLAGFIVLVCLPPLPVKKILAGLLLLPFISYLLPANRDFWRVDVLDVGQGLAVMVQADDKMLVYDVGPAYPSGFNMADAVLIPVLQQRGIHRLDWVFVSHQDMDHAGSLQPLTEQIKVDRVVSNQDHCQKGWNTVWQGLTLQVLWPGREQAGNENNLSCVLRISDGQHHVLLPGDIEQQTETTLVNHTEIAPQLDADILVVPHHGSATSSSVDFINAVSPGYVVFSLGYLNRWNFPNQQVYQRYVDAGSKLFATDKQGQISFFIYPDRIETRTYRQDIYPYWYANH